ncbi:MAG: hypothetical protein AAB365_02875 [Patescibacteria group bacterium]
MKKLFYVFSVCVVSAFVICGFALPARAETRYSTATIIRTDTSWEASGSPYIVEDDVIVEAGATLTIGPGVEVRGPETGYKPSFSLPGGTLKIVGTEQERVRLHNLNGIFTINGGSVTTEYADLDRLNMGVLFENSRGVIASSSITRSLYGIEVRTSGVSVWASEISGNADGIIVQRAPGPFLVYGDSQMSDMGTGGIGNALEDLPIGKNSVKVIGSIIEGNLNSGINSKDWSTVSAPGNWWGSPDGPGAGGISNPILGKVKFEPFLTERPIFGSEEASCCSSILFIPGLQASRLYKNERQVSGIGVNRLWEPNRNDDVRKLFLSRSGSSTDAGIYAGDPIDRALGVSGIYGSFMSSLDMLRDEGTIGEWKSFGYDWRKPIAEVVAGQQQRATTTESLIGTLESLAARSKTGKVSIVAHSNGGLVAKYLVKTLVDMGKEDLVESVISVAVPYLGTPQAILGLLHGANQSIGGGIILKQGVARELGINMPSAYSLLPSREYFSKALGPSIAFAATSTLGMNATVYPRVIESYDDQKAFILDTKAGRNTSTASKPVMPIEGNTLLMSAAEALHSVLDPFQWPSTIARWAIVGWGNRTAKGVVYSKSGYTATTTSLGDGTVVMPSAIHDAGDVVAIDLSVQKDIDRKKIDHTNILESSATKAAVQAIVASADAENKGQVRAALSVLPGVTLGEPDQSQEKTFLVVSTHSPVDLHVYDSHGNHTGIMAPPEGRVTGENDGGFDDLYSFFEDEIPGSSFDMYEGSDGNETYITLEDSMPQPYSVVVNGNGVGTFDYTIERIRGDEVLDRVEYIGLPVNPLTVATGTVVVSNGIKLASSTMIRVDIDGNGSTDIVPRPGIAPDFKLHLEMLKKAVILLVGDSKKSNNILKRIERLEALAKKDRIGRVHMVAHRLKIRVAHKKQKLLTVEEREQIIGMIDTFLAQFE